MNEKMEKIEADLRIEKEKNQVKITSSVVANLSLLQHKTSLVVVALLLEWSLP